MEGSLVWGLGSVLWLRKEHVTLHCGHPLGWAASANKGGGLPALSGQRRIDMCSPKHLKTLN